MEFVIVERSYEAPTDIADVAAQEQAVAWCLEQHRVTYKYSYFSRSRRHMLCYYEAPDVEAVRMTQDTGGLAYDHIWAGTPFPAPKPPERPEGYELLIVQRDIPVDLDLFAPGVLPDPDCFERHRVTLRHSHRSGRGDRMVCCFHAPDADSVRLVGDQGTVPAVRIWPATYHPA